MEDAGPSSYNPLLTLMVDNNRGRIAELERNLKSSLKVFAGLCNSTSDALLGKLLPFNIRELAGAQRELALEKWQLRLKGSPIGDLPREKCVKTPLLPKSFAKFCNLQKTSCKECRNGSRNNYSHLKFSHNLLIPSPIELIEKLETRFPCARKLSRRLKLEERSRLIQTYIDIILNHMS